MNGRCEIIDIEKAVLAYTRLSDEYEAKGKEIESLILQLCSCVAQVQREAIIIKETLIDLSRSLEKINGK